jgi:type II secretory pathway pseudopilin PulG
VSTQVRETIRRPDVRQIRVTRIPFGLGVGETIATLLAFVLILWVLVYYFSSLKPEQNRLRTIESQLDAQQRSIIANRPDAVKDVPAEDQAKTALETLDTFKENHLKSFSSGRIALIREINALAKKNNVSLTSGIDMGSTGGEADSESDQTGEKKNVSRRKKTDDLLNAFPSVNFRFTVFGQYSNLRTFIGELEREKQFVVINSINLTNQEAKTASRRARGAEGAAGIMLTIEMTGYFQPV